MWRDMGLYWAWLFGNGLCNSDPPTKKRILYAKIQYPGCDAAGFDLAVAVFDDERMTQINRDELDWHRRNGAEITMPPEPNASLSGGSRPSA